MAKKKAQNEQGDSGKDLVLGEDLPEVRRIWHEGEWYYAITDFIRIWTSSPNPSQYWTNMKMRADSELKNVIDTQLVWFPMKSSDNRMRQTETANRETLLRLVQSVPSKNAEKIRLWLAAVGNQKLEELEQEQSELEKLRASYRKKGYDDVWVETRIADLLARNEITATWHERGAQDIDYPMLTNVLTERTFGYTVKSYKAYKGISQSANLPDNMTPAELALNVLSKETAKTYHEVRDSQGLDNLHRDVIDAGNTTRAAKEIIERETGVPIVSPKNAKDLRQLAPHKTKKKSLSSPDA